MIVAIFSEDHFESLQDGVTLAGATPLEARFLDPEEPWIGEADLLVAELGSQPMRQLRELGRLAEIVGLPVLLIVSSDQLALIESSDAIADFLVRPVDPIELRLRVIRLGRSAETEEVLLFKDLELNTLNYQAHLAGEPMDLTFMEYELLRFLMENPVRVWSREQLLSKVWGYEYYGGARTVDVHVRRLRAKLGEERASWITTVRSVGYRWG
ncbi:MAG: response regulator transcription factor [Acidimicrobiia bacterium]|nr:response regulator transcription factor [Acidimicrobiia bacterium]